MNNKLVIAIAVLMVAALVAPGVMAADVPYTATVTSGQSTTVTFNGTFGSVVTGSGFDANIIVDSITCNNVGTDAATVDAAFTSNDGTTYGLTTGDPVVDVIGGSNFQLGKPTTFDALNDEGNDVTLTNGVPAASTVYYDARLQVPAGQTAGDYSGTVQLTFS